MSASSLISHLKTCNGNQAMIEGKFKEWMDLNFTNGISYSWDANAIKAIFGEPLITNDVIRSNCIKYFAIKNLEIGGRASIGDLCALVTTTSNEVLKEEYVKLMAPITVDGDRSHLCSLFSNIILKGNISKMPFGSRKIDNGDAELSADNDIADNDDDNEYNGPPPNYNGGPPPFGSMGGFGGMPQGMGGFGGMPQGMGGFGGMPQGMGGFGGMPQGNGFDDDEGGFP